MKIRFKYKSAAKAEEDALKLPLGCNWRIVRTGGRTGLNPAYLDIDEEYKVYHKRYIYTPFHEQ